MLTGSHGTTPGTVRGAWPAGRPDLPPDAAPGTSDRAGRLADLRRCGFLDAPPEPALGRVTDLAHAIFGLRKAAVSLVEGGGPWPRELGAAEEGRAPRGWTIRPDMIPGDEPILVPDTRQDLRFAADPLVTGGPRIRFFAGAPVVLRGGLQLGAVCVASRRPRVGRVYREDARRLRTLASAVAEMLELRLRQGMEAEAAAERDDALRRADLLAREADHRIKNGLQAIQKVLRLGADAAPHAEACAALKAASDRVLAVAAAHRHLQDAARPGQSDAAAYLRDLVRDLVPPGAEGGAARPVTVEADPSLSLAPRLLPSIGLVVAELVSNAMKHGAGRIRVELRSVPAGGAIVAVADEGPGFPPGFDCAARGRSLGLRLVGAIAGRGNLRVDEHDRRRIVARLAAGSVPPCR